MAKRFHMNHEFATAVWVAAFAAEARLLVLNDECELTAENARRCAEVADHVVKAGGVGGGVTTPCPWCGARVEVGNTGLVVVFCTAKLTTYRKRGQVTGVVGHTHGLGYPPTAC